MGMMMMIVNQVFVRGGGGKFHDSAVAYVVDEWKDRTDRQTDKFDDKKRQQ